MKEHSGSASRAARWSKRYGKSPRESREKKPDKILFPWERVYGERVCQASPVTITDTTIARTR